jgi:hypothetical protein
MTPDAPNEQTPEAAEPALAPNEQLARDIVTALKDNGLLDERRVQSAFQKIAAGRASQSDWQMWAEDLLLDEEAEGEGGGDTAG